MSRLPLITLKYKFPNEAEQEFSVQNVEPIDINYVSPIAASSNESFEYSGRHDQGTLPQLNSVGPMVNIVSAMIQGKKISDKFLTERINQFYGYGDNQNADQEDIDKEPVSDEETATKKISKKQANETGKRLKQSKKDLKREEVQVKRAKIESKDSIQGITKMEVEQS
eukprot:gene2421-2572_t